MAVDPYGWPRRGYRDLPPPSENLKAAPGRLLVRYGTGRDRAVDRVVLVRCLSDGFRGSLRLR